MCPTKACVHKTVYCFCHTPNVDIYSTFTSNLLRPTVYSLNWLMDICQILKSVVKLTGIWNEWNIAANMSPNPC